MRNILRRPRTRGVVVAAALAGGLVCGLVAPVAEAAAATCSTTYLSLGSTGTCVRQLQTNLGGLSVDGVYGSGTQSRVRSFQDDAGIAVDGKVGPQTWAKLRKYGKALGWKAGVTVYMCKSSSAHFQYSAWNNSGKSASWTLELSNGWIFGETVGDDKIVIQSTRLIAGTYDSDKFWAFLAGQEGQFTTNVRDFSPTTLPACG